MKYKTTWFLVIEPTPFGNYIKAVFGAALGEDAEKSAEECNGFIRHICSYGITYHAGQIFTG